MKNCSAQAIGAAALLLLTLIGVALAGTWFYVSSQPVICKLETSTRARLTMLASALEFYRLDNSRYPSTEQGLEALVGPPAPPPHPSNYPEGGYLKKQTLLLDAWGRPISYESSGEAFALVSLGADGIRGGEGQDTDLFERGGTP